MCGRQEQAPDRGAKHRPAIGLGMFTMGSTRSSVRSSISSISSISSGHRGIIRIEPLDAIGSTRRRRRGRICCDRRTATCQHVAAVVLHAGGRLLAERHREGRGARRRVDESQVIDRSELHRQRKSCSRTVAQCAARRGRDAASLSILRLFVV